MTWALAPEGVLLNPNNASSQVASELSYAPLDPTFQPAVHEKYFVGKIRLNAFFFGDAPAPTLNCDPAQIVGE
jgi:hypothetical protein